MSPTFCVYDPFSQHTNRIIGGMFCGGERIRAYPVYVRSSSGCSMGTPFPTVTITSTKNNVQESVAPTHFPNPAHDVLQISGQVGELEIFDLQGETIVSDHNPGQKISIAHFPSGLYIHRITDSRNGKIFHGKLVKE